MTSQLTQTSWRIAVGQAVYGPYSRDEMRRFVRDGRLFGDSEVQADGVGPWLRAAVEPRLAEFFNLSASAHVGGPSNFIVVAHVSARQVNAFDKAISAMGLALRINPQVWLLHADRTSGTIRNDLVQHCASSDMLLVVDATRSKLAWFNLAAETDAKIRAVWK